MSSNLGAVARQTHADTVQAVLITTTDGEEVGFFSQVVDDDDWCWVWHFDREDHRVNPFGMILRTNTHKALGYAQVCLTGALRLRLRRGLISTELVLNEDTAENEELLDDPFFTTGGEVTSNTPQVICGASTPMFRHTPLKWVLWRIGFAT